MFWDILECKNLGCIEELASTSQFKQLGTMLQMSGFFFRALFARTAEEGPRPRDDFVSAMGLQVGPESYPRVWAAPAS